MKISNALKRVLGSRQGFTLIEVMVATVLLTIGALMLAVGFSASNSVIREGVNVGKAGRAASAVIEGASLGAGVTMETAQPGNVTFTLNGSAIQIHGNYSTAQGTAGTDTSVLLNIFIPDSAPVT